MVEGLGFEPGQRIEDYLLLKHMGKGGMADIFLARDVVLKRRVVIKAMDQCFLKVERFRSQFLREARIQANLDSPYIVQVLRVIEAGGRPCLIMPHVKGTDLERVIKRAVEMRAERGERGGLSEQRAVHIFLQILEGIGFAHKYGIVHGDLKPSNVLLDQQGRARVVDFGLSFLLSPAKKTGASLPGGTPSYISPEQLLSQGVDHRADIYSLGVTLFRMLTGRLPLGEKKITEILEHHVVGSLEGVIALLEEFKDISQGTRTAVLKALENDPDRRHQSCLEFSLALREAASPEMYSELLRMGLVTKQKISVEERAYLDRIADARGFRPDAARALEAGIRKEMGLPPLDFLNEYGRALKDLHEKGRGSDPRFLDELERVYVKTCRISAEQAGMLREELKAGNLRC